MNAMPSITVAGAGALGLTTALELARAGCTVTVFDPAAAGDNASGVAAGMLAPAFEAALDPLVAPHLDLMLAARNLWPELEARLGVTVDRSGAAAVGGRDYLAKADQALRRVGLHPTGLSRRALAGLAPDLGEGLGDAVLTREDWRIEPQAVLAALRAAADAAGVGFQARAATGFEGAERLVIATGASRDLGVMAPKMSLLSPIKGQIVRVAAQVACGLSLRTEGAYAVAGSDGLVLGATMEAGREDREVEAAALAPLLAAGQRLFPKIAGAAHSGQAGVRAATPDGLPLVGRGAHHDVLLAVGARRNGWLLAPLVARIVTACVTEGEAGPYAARLDPLRFDRA
jgi:glycine oxidase